MSVLVIAAHPDDEVLGCGGTIARHVAMGDKVNLLFIADGETGRIMAAKPNRNIAAFAASKILGAEPPVFLDWRDQTLDTIPLLEITQAVEAEIERVTPTIVYTHHAGDLNKDHRLVHEAVMTALRPLPSCPVKEIYTFEVLSSTEWGVLYPPYFIPNHFVCISAFLKQKLRALECYSSEMREEPHARSMISVERLAGFRGNSVGIMRAEAFMTIRTIR
jgi:N-acetylglucosamine malate deacetylase 1